MPEDTTVHLSIKCSLELREAFTNKCGHREVSRVLRRFMRDYVNGKIKYESELRTIENDN